MFSSASSSQLAWTSITQTHHLLSGGVWPEVVSMEELHPKSHSLWHGNRSHQEPRPCFTVACTEPLRRRSPAGLLLQPKVSYSHSAAATSLQPSCCVLLPSWPVAWQRFLLQSGAAFNLPAFNSCVQVSLEEGWSHQILMWSRFFFCLCNTFLIKINH